MLRILKPDDFITNPWKNGGGITHEIARKEDAQGLLWRISIAEVGSDGPFSLFEGLARILTVIDGAGLILRTPGGEMDASPLHPVAFSGDTPVEGCLIEGPVRDFNLIYDPTRIAASVEIIASPGPVSLGGDLGASLTLAGPVMVACQICPKGSIALGSGGRIDLDAGASILLVVLRNL